jgi:hypothetical protein
MAQQAGMKVIDEAYDGDLDQDKDLRLESNLPTDRNQEDAEDIDATSETPRAQLMD